jgi:hypothetical protein
MRPPEKTDGKEYRVMTEVRVPISLRERVDKIGGFKSKNERLVAVIARGVECFEKENK